MRTCGIDLGTTNSCIVVVGDEEYTQIRDEQGSAVFPSVVYIGKDGKSVVGLAAKNRLGERNGPVATIKRKKGSTETVTLGGRAHTSVAVSAMILRYLRELAERTIGDTVDRAVVTVPAYFNHIQRQHTDAAAREAGFAEVVTLLEPVAAALAYSLESDRERLRVFVYDLGGGTFDATVLEKDAYGGLTVLSFGGDAFLGGDDVDARLARLIVRRLVEQGFKLDLDLRRPEDQSRLQRLKFHAEVIKQHLTDAESYAFTRQGLFEDQAGMLVDVDLTITRQDLEDCCRDLVQRTIDASLATLRKEGRDISVDSIDEVIMVGGMSRMPLVQRMLAEGFQRTPKVVNPDLIVGLGAALKAAEVFADRAVAASGLTLTLRYDRRTDQEHVRIAGLFDRVTRSHSVFLVGDRHDLYQMLDGTDRFSFEEVTLTPDTTNVFALSIEDDSGTPVIQRELRIVHDSRVTPVLASPGSVVTKPIAIGTLDGAAILFPENTALPHSIRHPFETTDQSGRIVAPILEGDHELERLEIRDIPCDLPIGTSVTVEAAIHADYRIEARAIVPDIKREVSITFEIRPVDTAKITPDYVRQRLKEIEDKARTATQVCPSPDAVKIFEFRLTMLKDEIELEVGEMEPKTARLHEKLAACEALVRRLPRAPEAAELKPSHDEFSQRLQSIVAQAIEIDHKRLPECQPRIEELRRMAREAWTRHDPIAWRRVNGQLSAIATILQPEVSTLERALGTAAWIAVVQVEEMRSAAGRRLQKEIATIEDEASQIFRLCQMQALDPGQAITRLVMLYQKTVVPLRRTLGLESEPEPVTAPQVGEGALRAARKGQ